MNYNDDVIHNKNYLLIIPTISKQYFKYLNYSFNNIILFNNKKDLESIINFINNNNFKQLIFVDYVPEYLDIINSIKNKHIYKILFTYSLGGFSNKSIYSDFKNIMHLYNTNKINSIGFIDNNLYETLKNKNIKLFHISLDVPKNNFINNENKSLNKTIGILSDENQLTHSFYNSLSALKFKDYTAKILKASKVTKNFLKLFKIKYINCKTNQELMENNYANLYVNFTDNNDLVFIESMDRGVPCILGNNGILKKGYLKDMLVVESDDSVDEISNKLFNAIKNKSKILNEYKNFRIKYSKQSKKEIEEFLGCRVEKKCIISDSNLLLSIVVPVYNTEKYLDACLKSILKALPNKIRTKTEILIINDGSNDDSEEIILKYKNKYPILINYIKQNNHGLGNVRNVALKIAKGKYIASIDSDDTINKSFFKEALEYMKNDVDIIIYDWLSVTDNSKFETSAIEWVFNDLNKYEGLLYTTIMPSTCNKIIKKNLYDNLKIKFMEDKYEDLSTNPFVMLSAKTIKYINKPYYEYYIRSDSIMRSSAGYSMIDVLKEVDCRLNNYNKYVNVDIKKFKYYTYSWRIEEFIFNQLYELNDKDLEDFINYVYDNLYDVVINIFNSNYYCKMLNSLDSDITSYIIERNNYFKNKKLKSFIKSKANKELKLNAYVIYYGKKGLLQN